MIFSTKRGHQALNHFESHDSGFGSSSFGSGRGVWSRATGEDLDVGAHVAPGSLSEGSASHGTSAMARNEENSGTGRWALRTW